MEPMNTELTQHVQELTLTDSNFDKQIAVFGQAISSPIRLKIFRQINQSPMTLVEVAKKNNITNSTALFHLKLLQKAHMITSRYLPGKKGKAQVYFVYFDGVFFKRKALVEESLQIFEQSVKVGQYVDIDCKVVGIATQKTQMPIGLKPYCNDRFDAELLWTDGGKVTYALDNSFCKNSTVQELNFSLEICSEARFYRNDWKSNITFAVNSTELLTYTSPGDFGGVRGKLNPDWWGNENTQYGILINISVMQDGTYLNSQKVSSVTINDLKIEQDKKLLFSIFNKPNAEHYGGFNLFGKNFGNYPQDILFTAKYTKNF